MTHILQTSLTLLCNKGDVKDIVIYIQNGYTLK